MLLDCSQFKSPWRPRIVSEGRHKSRNLPLFPSPASSSSSNNKSSKVHDSFKHLISFKQLKVVVWKSFSQFPSHSGHGRSFSKGTSTENRCCREISGFDFNGQTNSKTDFKVDTTFCGKTPMSLKHDKKSTAYWHCRCFHRRMPGGTISGFTKGCNEGTKNPATGTISVDFDLHLRESLQDDKLLSSLISAFCTLADSELVPSTTEPIKVWSHWKNPLSYDDPYPTNIIYFNRKVNIIYQVNSIKHCIDSIERKFCLFAAATFFAFSAQVEFQLKK